jgi:signal transduction histidine kinase
LKLETHLPEQPLVALADETRLAQVVINLLTNAVKFTPAGGAVVVELAQEANVAVLSVRDTGAGISPALLPQLFTMFFQAQPPAPMLKTGLGVGLALAKIPTEMHGGKIEAQSEGEGKGATFEIRLPLSEAEDAGEPRFLTNRILIVDDNPDQLHLMAEVLKLRGFEVVAAENAAEALRLVQQHRPRA